ncbi:MAG: type III-A CRISPR-associated RAMP protein Csm3 [Ignavibacteria bacterium]|nr:type III-A CRISPR-associated RAMP protein Csm3 [Ignavibacteria bacterium]
MAQAEFIGNIILKGKIECITGLHIGGSKEKLEIGAVDSPVIRDPVTNYPYIPGSSLKGKLRSLLSYSLGFKYDSAGKDDYKEHETIYFIFGAGANDKNRPDGPTRLIVRDAYPDEKTIRMWEELDSELLYTEYKAENTLDKLTSAANPRFLERVVKGSHFNFEIIYGIYQIGENKDNPEDFKFVVDAMRLLENSYLGGSGTRGYGQVAFKLMEPIILFRKDYEEGSENFVRASKSIDVLFPDGFKHLRLSDFDDKFIQENIMGKFQG